MTIIYIWASEDDMIRKQQILTQIVLSLLRPRGGVLGSDFGFIYMGPDSGIVPSSMKSELYHCLSTS
jgi:hypothetical protein